MKGLPSQQFVPIKSIRDGVMILENNDHRAILSTNSLNLALKSEDEQTAILTQFQNFFNSLDFPVQIFVSSRRANLEPYIELLSGRMNKIKEELMKLQIIEYIDYIKTFNEETNIMEKRFFVIVPYTPAVLGGNSSQSKSGPLSFLPFGKADTNSSLEIKSFMETKRQLDQRVSVVISGLTRCGLLTKQLQTQEIIELFYGIFNPGTEGKAIVD